MTAEELGFASRRSARASGDLQLLAEAAVAVPADASTRMILGAGMSLQRRRLTVTVPAQTGALYAPFTARGVADLSYAF